MSGLSRAKLSATSLTASSWTLQYENVLDQQEVAEVEEEGAAADEDDVEFVEGDEEDEEEEEEEVRGGGEKMNGCASCVWAEGGSLPKPDSFADWVLKLGTDAELPLLLRPLLDAG